MEVAPGIHRIEAPLGDRCVCMFLIVDAGCVLLVDTGLDPMPATVLQPYLGRIGLGPEAVETILNTHADFDHIGGNAAARRIFPQARFMASMEDAAWIEQPHRLVRENYGQFEEPHAFARDSASEEWILSVTKPARLDVMLQGELLLRVGERRVRLMRTGGHTRGHLAVWDPVGRVAIVADAVLKDALYTVAGAAAFPPTYRHVREYQRTIERLRQLDPGMLLTSHYPVAQGSDVMRFLERSASFVDEAESALVGEVQRSGAVTLRELCDRLGPKLGRWPRNADHFLAYPLVGHLEALEEEGLIHVNRMKTPWSYRLKIA